MCKIYVSLAIQPVQCKYHDDDEKERFIHFYFAIYKIGLNMTWDWISFNLHYYDNILKLLIWRLKFKWRDVEGRTSFAKRFASFVFNAQNHLIFIHFEKPKTRFDAIIIRIEIHPNIKIALAKGVHRSVSHSHRKYPVRSFTTLRMEYLYLGILRFKMTQMAHSQSLSNIHKWELKKHVKWCASKISTFKLNDSTMFRFSNVLRYYSQ